MVFCAGLGAVIPTRWHHAAQHASGVSGRDLPRHGSWGPPGGHMETPMSYDTQKGREDLLAFEREQPDNFWRADPHLQRVVRYWAGEDAVAAWEDDLDRFGGECAGPIDQAVRENNLNHNLPVLRRWGPYGDRIEEVEHHPSYHEAGRIDRKSTRLNSSHLRI